LTDWTRLAAHVLEKGTALVPDKFPPPSAVTAQAWGEALSQVNVPVEVWPEAVTWWSLNRAKWGKATPQDLKEAAEAVLRRWESDPSKLPELVGRRLAARENRDRRIGDIVGGERIALE
jgi:hypothetical protein